MGGTPETNTVCHGKQFSNDLKIDFDFNKKSLTFNIEIFASPLRPLR